MGARTQKVLNNFTAFKKTANHDPNGDSMHLFSYQISKYHQMKESPQIIHHL